MISKKYFEKLNNFVQDPEKRVFVVLLVVLLSLLAFKLNFFTRIFSFRKVNSFPPEILAIKKTSVLDEQVVLYKKLIDRVGAVEAQEDLFKSGLPFTGETHLLNHTVGDYLYEKYGPAGLVKCRDYFLSSCYHGFVLHAIADGGMPEVAKTFAECNKGGFTVSSQCAHAIGHGFLANTGYKDLVKALQTCDQATSTMPGFPPFNCYDGVFMENIWAVHDGEPSPDRWVRESDKVYPCNDKRIDDKYILACWSNQPSLAYQLFGGDIKKVAELCNTVKRPEYEQMCFDGLARQIHPMAGSDPKQTLALCSSMPTIKWINYCMSTNASAGYAVGDRDMPFLVCSEVGASGQEECYSKLFSTMRAYKKANESTQTLCAKVADSTWREKCKSTL